MYRFHFSLPFWSDGNCSFDGYWGILAMLILVGIDVCVVKLFPKSCVWSSFTKFRQEVCFHFYDQPDSLGKISPVLPSRIRLLFMATNHYAFILTIKVGSTRVSDDALNLRGFFHWSYWSFPNCWRFRIICNRTFVGFVPLKELGGNVGPFDEERGMPRLSLFHSRNSYNWSLLG